MFALQLELRHYETVLAAIEFGTLTEAAKHLSTSQSALSHRLAEAERRLGTPLFERGPRRRLSPTRAGLALHQAASRALGDLAATEATLLSQQRGVVTTLRIAVGSYDCYHWFPQFLHTTRDRHPHLDLELVVVGDAPGPALASGAVDLVIAPGNPEGSVELHELFDDELVLVVAPDHHLATSDGVEAMDLGTETYLTYNAQPTPGFEYDQFIRPAGVYPQLVKVVRQTSAITELVAAGAGVSILSRWALTPAIDAKRVVPKRCGADGLSLRWNAVIRRSEAQDSPARQIAADLAADLAG